LLNLVEEPFDQIAGTVEIWAEADRIIAIASLSRRPVDNNSLYSEEVRSHFDLPRK
jgi:hypothetical protein